MINIPSWAQSSVDPTQVSLTIQSLGKMGASLIVFLGAIGWVDPALAQQSWGTLVDSIVTAVPAGFAAYHAVQLLYGLFRKGAVRVVGATVTPSA